MKRIAYFGRNCSPGKPNCCATVIAKKKKQILKLSHETHQGLKTKQSLRTRFYWPGMDDATETMEKNCQGCVVNQPLDKYTPLQPTPLPRGLWVKGAVDLVGPIDGKSILAHID